MLPAVVRRLCSGCWLVKAAAAEADGVEPLPMVASHNKRRTLSPRSMNCRGRRGADWISYLQQARQASSAGAEACSLETALCRA